MKKYCSRCGNGVDESFDYCPYCGNKDLRTQKPKSSKLNNCNNQLRAYYGNEDKLILEQNKGLKNASLLLGIFSFFGGGFIVALVGLVLGKLYKNKTRQSCAGTWINGFSILFHILILGFFIFLFFSADFQKVDDSEYIDEEINTVVIGDQNYGYVTIPDYWIKSSYGGLEQLSYYGIDEYDECYTISLSYFDDTGVVLSEYLETVKKQLTDSSVDIYETMEVLVDNNFAYRINGYSLDANNYISVWIFKDLNGKIHYIAIDGADRNSEYFDLINTFES